ncbi:ParB/RepB/Spo0J family partition protein [Scytonema hofmannii FACHB-248]|uniref:ParB/RepB/Spo0J family partition protein n=1 Tax=Scytonema hofmannii FACHB-248 TaxID=1842502 RepID=A0ABR8GWA2_9CYAN|nr:MULTISPECIES: ParB/RepB/Spo0J family partition protein [Nostocales]MBD2607359.1 ParB/RepB/Spo0J family partition protein [Scytonema hofmannii FACHB-248]
MIRKRNQPLKSQIEVPWDPRSDLSPNAAAESTHNVPLEQISLPQQQPRRYFDPQALNELISSVKQHGILQPLLVRPIDEGKYELVAGERRYRAAKDCGLEKVPVVVRELSNEDAFQLALIENLLREDLNPVEETEGILQLLAVRLKRNVESVPTLLHRLQREQKEAAKLANNVIGKSEASAQNSANNVIGKNDLDEPDTADNESDKPESANNVIGKSEASDNELDSANNVIGKRESDEMESANNVIGKTESDPDAANNVIGKNESDDEPESANNIIGKNESDDEPESANNIIGKNESDEGKSANNVIGKNESEESDSANNVIGKNESDGSSPSPNPNLSVNPDLKIIEEVFTGLGTMTWESFVNNRLPLLNLPEDILNVLRSGQIAYTKAKVIAQIKEDLTRQTVLEKAVANNWSLSQIKEHIQTLSPTTPPPTPLKSRLDATIRQVKKARIWDDPNKQTRLETLLAELETLLTEN